MAEIDLDHIVLDELHLMLRVVDVLMDNLIEDVSEWDKTEDKSKKGNEERVVLNETMMWLVALSCGSRISGIVMKC